MNALDDSANTDRCTLYEDSANLLKDERFTKTERQTSFERWTPRTQESVSSSCMTPWNVLRHQCHAGPLGTEVSVVKCSNCGKCSSCSKCSKCSELLTQESPHEIARQSEAKLKQAPQGEANVCRRRRRRKYNLKKPPLLIAQDTQ